MLKKWLHNTILQSENQIFDYPHYDQEKVRTICLNLFEVYDKSKDRQFEAMGNTYQISYASFSGPNEMQIEYLCMLEL